MGRPRRKGTHRMSSRTWRSRRARLRGWLMCGRYDVMHCPVRAADNFVYDRFNIQLYFARERRAGRPLRSPMTGAVLTSDCLTELAELREQIAHWRRQRVVRKRNKKSNSLLNSVMGEEKKPNRRLSSNSKVNNGVETFSALSVSVSVTPVGNTENSPLLQNEENTTPSVANTPSSEPAEGEAGDALSPGSKSSVSLPRRLSDPETSTPEQGASNCLVIREGEAAIDKLFRGLKDGDHVVFEGESFVIAHPLFVIGRGIAISGSTTVATVITFTCESGDGFTFAGLGCSFENLRVVHNGKVANYDEPLPSCVSAIQNGSVTVRNCQFSSPGTGNGVCSIGAGAVMRLQDCQVSGCAKVGVVALSEGQVIADNCVVTGEKTRSHCFCVLADNRGKIVMNNCKLQDSGSVCLMVSQEAHVVINDSTVSGSVNREGLCATGAGASLEASRCTISNCGDALVAALYGARLRLEDCTVTNGEHQGVSSHGANSAVEMVRCRIADVKDACCTAMRGGKLLLEDSNIRNSRAMQGEACCSLAKLLTPCRRYLSGQGFNGIAPGVADRRLLRNACPGAGRRPRPGGGLQPVWVVPDAGCVCRRTPVRG